MEFIGNNPNAFRLLLRERSGTSAAFRAAVARLNPVAAYMETSTMTGHGLDAWVGWLTRASDVEP